MENLFLGTSFADYAIENKSINQNNDFIEHKKGTAKFSFAFIYNDFTFGVWFDYTLGKIYVSNDYIKDYPFTFACTLKDHTPNTMFLSTAKKYTCWKNFITNYNLGNVRFENQKIKFVVQDLLKLILSR